MGILNLYDVLKEEAPDAVVEHHLSEFNGIKVAIDSSIFLYRFIRTAGPVDWMKLFIDFLCALKKNGIKAICIFDGQAPPEKLAEQQARRANNAKSIERMEKAVELRAILQDEYQSRPGKPIPEQLVETCKSVIHVRKGYVDPTDYTSASDIIGSLQATIDRLEKSTLPITDKYRIMATKICKMFGVKAIRAPGEAEKLCAYLAVEGLADAVLTEDTDVLVYGTPFMMAFRDSKKNETITVITLERILRDMSIDHYTFRDMCIMLKCDYNKRTKGYPVDGRKYKTMQCLGHKKIPDFIRTYGDIDKAHQAGALIVEPLNHNRCRELFSFNEEYEDVDIPPYKEPNYEKIRDLVIKYNLHISLAYIKKCHEPVKIVVEEQ